MEHKTMKKYDVEIKVIDCFKGNPRYRYSIDVVAGEEDTSGQRFREAFLLPALQKHHTVNVILTGYNRYDPSFLIAGFADLIRENGFTYDELKSRLFYVHDHLKSFEILIDEEMQIAEQERVKKQEVK